MCQLMDVVVVLTHEEFTSCGFLLVRVRIQYAVSSTLGEIHLKKEKTCQSEENGTVTKLLTIERNNQLPTGIFKNKTDL